MNIGIIGGGIIGLSSAYYLMKAGHRVTVINQSDGHESCSTGNAGMIVPSHIIPLASPGMISKGIRWMFNSTSPFYVRPRLSGDLIKWGWEFYRHANKRHVDRTAPALRDISLLSKAMYQELSRALPFDFGYHERGLLMLYQTKETEHEEVEGAAYANKLGIEARVLSSKEVQELEPDVRVTARGGVYYPGDAHITPQVLMHRLMPYLQQQGVNFMPSTSVTDFRVENGKIKTVITSRGELDFDEVVLATGSWSGVMTSKLGISLPMQAGKGYSFTLQNVEKNSRIPSIFLEARVAVTPMGNTLRFGGTMEITGIDHTINMNRVRGIVEAIPTYYPEMKVDMPKKEQIWHGLRPCSPDGLPYIGRSSTISNLVFATGHAMMGLSLGPGTGKLVSEIINQEKTSIDIKPFNPERF
ncbi:MAG: FAD-dependent oxidoreductase [Cyclobacteriaceae bacterium]|jgi:D-amino-acid dehydrogenase|nr:FAD-dependent oxidoreductase [Cyclobacteriaceae bacterium]